MPTAKQLQNAKTKLKKTPKSNGNKPVTYSSPSSFNCCRPQDSKES